AVSRYVEGLVSRRVHEHGLVVWYDPEGHYRELAGRLVIPETTFLRYEGSFYALRREFDPLLNGNEAPRLVVYVPLHQRETDHALTEAEALGTVIQPGQQPPSHNTQLAAITRAALSRVISPKRVAEVEKQVEEGKLTLADLDALASKGDAI